jgi:hypothetical protein
MQPLNGSYINRWIVNNFSNICLIDTHLDKLFVVGDTKKQKIIIVDNEVLVNIDDLLPEYLIESDNIYITKVSFFKKKQEDNEIRFPFFDILEDIFALNYITNKDAMQLIMPDNLTYTFLSLNRSVREHRQILIDHLCDYNLLQSSFVTYHRSNRQIPDLKDINFEWYKKDSIPPDRVYNNFYSIPCTTNFLNYFVIKKQIQTPICLMAETTMGTFYPCEKSFLPLFTARIPIILSSKGHIEIMRSEGFDFFDDLVDHSYDQKTKPVDRIKTAIDLNYNLLRN